MQTETNISVNGNTTRKRENVLICSIQYMKNMKENGMVSTCMAMVLIHMLMILNIEVHFKEGKNMELLNLLIFMEIHKGRLGHWVNNIRIPIIRRFYFDIN